MGIMAGHPSKTIRPVTIKKHDTDFNGAHTVLAGYSFSAREFDVLACLLCSKSSKSKKIAALLAINTRTVDAHVYILNNKVGVRSRVDLIHFIEKYGDAEMLSAHYAKILRAQHLREVLQKETLHIRGQHVTCRLLCTNSRKGLALLKKMSLNLKKVGIKVVEEAGVQNGHAIKTVHMVLPVDEEAKIKGVENTNTIQEEEPQESAGSVFTISATEGSEERLFLEIIDHLCPSREIKEALDYFRDNVTNNSQQYHALPSVQPFRPWWEWLPTVYVMFAFLLLCLCGFLYIKKAQNSTKNNNSFSEVVSVHSVAAIPDDTHRLDRKHLMSKMTQCFYNTPDIQTVVLVGIGGSGKTTLVRQYAKQQNVPLVWELNAETKNTLLESFAHLAWALSKTPEERSELERIKKIENQNNSNNSGNPGDVQALYRQKLIQYVKQKLASCFSPWILIFDDVKILSDIQEFLPLDVKAWGKGAVIITTRNGTIAESTLIKKSNVITVDELSVDEKLALFLKIKEVQPTQHKELVQFLRVIPPFPLDISIAAYYLKNTNSSYADYLRQLQIEHSKIKVL